MGGLSLSASAHRGQRPDLLASAVLRLKVHATRLGQCSILNNAMEPGRVEQTCNPKSWEVEAGGPGAQEHLQYMI